MYESIALMMLSGLFAYLYINDKGETTSKGAIIADHSLFKFLYATGIFTMMAFALFSATNITTTDQYASAGNTITIVNYGAVAFGNSGQLFQIGGWLLFIIGGIYFLGWLLSLYDFIMGGG